MSGAAGCVCFGAMRARPVTIADVAERAGVSIATVSKVLNDRWGVAAATSDHVRGVIAELGYVPGLGASSLRGQRTKVLGVLVTEIEPYSAELLKGISRAVLDAGYELLVHVGGEHRIEHDWDRRSAARLGGALVDGLVVVTPTGADLRVPIPCVAVDPHTLTSDSVPSVASDGRAGAMLATEHLLELGHRRIAFLGGRPGLESSQQRERGFRAAMRSAAAAVDESLVEVGNYRAESSAEPARRLLDRAAPPTAVVAANDLSAIEVVVVARELGLPVPAELSVVGFDDVPDAAACDPPLTTVAQPMQQLGTAAVRTLLAMLRGEPHRLRRRLATELVVRASTAPPRRVG